jgi:hypothetical protein
MHRSLLAESEGAIMRNLADKTYQKESWEMTREEYGNDRNRNIPIAYERTPEMIEWEHKQVIKQALSEGKPVPRHVLSEYKSEKWAQETLAEKVDDETE